MQFQTKKNVQAEFLEWVYNTYLSVVSTIWQANPRKEGMELVGFHYPLGWSDITLFCEFQI